MSAPTPNAASAAGRDVIAIGASAGGIETLARLVGALPADLPAAVLAVAHRSPASSNALPAILSRAGPLPAATAATGTDAVLPLERVAAALAAAAAPGAAR